MPTPLTQAQTENLLAACKLDEALENKLDAGILDFAADLKRNFWPAGATTADIQAHLDYILLREKAGTGRPLAALFAKSKAVLSVMEACYPAQVIAVRPPCEFVAYLDGAHVGFVVVPIAYDPERASYPVQADRETAETFAAAQVIAE